MSAGVVVRRYRAEDWEELYRLVTLLFPAIADNPEAEAAALHAVTTSPTAAVFVADRGDGRLGGYVEAGTRPYADGCDTSPVGYVEAWYVDADLRRSGVGRALLAAAEDWARGMGYAEMASDAVLDNHTSHAAHRRCGYAEVDRVVQYRKRLSA